MWYNSIHNSGNSICSCHTASGISPNDFVESKLYKLWRWFIGLNIFQSVLLLLLLLSAFADLKTDRIPNGFILIGILIGFCGSLCAGRNILEISGSVSLAFLLLYPLYKIGALGAGDVKLFIMIGSFCQALELLFILAGAFVIGAVFSLVKLLVEHNGRERFYYFFSYLSEVMRSGHWKIYGEDLVKDYHAYRRNKIHFAVPILFSAAMRIGGLF